MNETTTTDPQGLEDPALLAEIEAEFAELTAEIQRISAMPKSAVPEKNKLIQALRESFRQRLVAHGDRPEWRKRLDDTVAHAVDRLIEDGLKENADGSLGFQLRGDTLQQEGGPLMRGLIEGFAHMLEEKFPPPDKQPPPPPDAPPPNPMQQLFGNLGQVLAGALKNAIASSAKGSVGPSGENKVSIDISATAPIATDKGVGASADVALDTEQKVQASIEFDSRKASGDAAAAPTAPTTAAAPAAPSNAANAFFQQLIAGFSQVVQKAVTSAVTLPARPSPAAPASAPQAAPGASASPAPAASASPAPAASASPAQTPSPAPAAEAVPPPEPATPGDAAPAAAAPVATSSAPAPEPAANPFANIGDVLAQALQRAVTAPNAPALKLTAVESTPPPAPSDPAAAAKSDASSAPSAASAPARGDDTAPEGAAAKPPPATMSIDFAGLLNQLLGGKKG